MKVLVHEYCSCQPPGVGAQTDALRAEGLAMLSAVLEDLARVPGVEPLALVAPDLTGLPFPTRAVTPDRERDLLCELAGRADYTLVIAPEIDRLLEERCRWVVEAGGKLLGPDPEAVRLTADKYELGRHLARHQVPTPPVHLLDEIPWTFPLVIKPRFGVGSLWTHVVRTKAEQLRVWEACPDIPRIQQPYQEGTPCSVAFLIGPSGRKALLPAAQRILEDEGQLSYAGGWAPLHPPLQKRAVALAGAAVRSVPGLRGFVGVDLILTDQPGRESDVVIEINPRLTTSYLGLRELCRDNLAGAMLEGVQGRRSMLRWRRDRTVHWNLDGSLWRE